MSFTAIILAAGKGTRMKSQLPKPMHQVAGQPMLGWVMTVPFNMASTHPVISIPSGFAANGVPTGVQIVGRSFCDQEVVAAAKALELPPQMMKSKV